MAYLLFIDESGQDHHESPYEVLAGAAVHDTHVWNLVCDIQDAEPVYFGISVSDDVHELKARKLLKRKVFRQARQASPLDNPERAERSAGALLHGSTATFRQIAALAQAKIAYVERVLELCAQHNVRFFASIIDPNAPVPAGDSLRKDYAYLFERFFYFVDEQPNHERGLVIFDELERSRAHLLMDQMNEYFRQTGTGRSRSGRIVPEPFFVHSDLTTGIRIADIVAYLISWNVRIPDRMTRERRTELDDLGRRVLDLRHKATLDRSGFPDGFTVWSFAYIDDLRPRSQRELEDSLQG